MPGGGGSGVCKSTCSPTPRIRGPFQGATSRPPFPNLLDLLLAEQPLREIHALRQLRDLLPHLLQLIQDLVTLGGIHARLAVFTRDALGDRRGHRSQDPERAAEEHECRDGFGPVHPWDLFASRRSAKSTRSPERRTRRPP